MKQLSLLLVLITQMAFSQQLPENMDVIHGGYYKILGPYPGSKSKVAALPNGETVFIVEGCFSYEMLYRFDKNMDLIKIEKLEHDWSAEAKGIEFMNDQLYLISYKYQKKIKQLDFFAQSYNPLDLTTTGTMEMGSLPISSKFNITTIEVNVVFSEDKSKIVLISNITAPRIEPEMNLFCYDNQMNLLWKKPKISYDDQDLFLRNFKVDNMGNVYRIHIEKEGDSKSLCYTTYSHSDIVTEEVELDNYAYSEITFSLIDSNCLMTMFYGNDLCTAKGICLINFNNITKKMDAPKMTEFPDDLLTDEIFTSDQSGLFSYNIQNVVPRANGDIAVIAVQEILKFPNLKDECEPYVNLEKYKAGVTIGGILVAIFSPEGEVREYYKIPVLQYSAMEDNRLRVASFEHNRNLYLFFNDNPENSANETVGRKPFLGNGDCINVMIQIDNEGNMSRYLLPKSPLGSNALITNSFRIINDHEIFFSSRMNEFKYLSSKVIID